MKFENGFVSFARSGAKDPTRDFGKNWSSVSLQQALPREWAFVL
jgi:hypothetical protein